LHCLRVVSMVSHKLILYLLFELSRCVRRRIIVKLAKLAHVGSCDVRRARASVGCAVQCQMTVDTGTDTDSITTWNGFHFSFSFCLDRIRWRASVILYLHCVLISTAYVGAWKQWNGTLWEWRRSGQCVQYCTALIQV